MKPMYTGLPNVLTLMRIIAIPIVICLMYLPGPFSDVFAVSLFIAACLTDYLDGYFARIWKQTSTFGRFLDPIADKLLVAAMLLALVELERIKGISLIPALIILGREILVSGLREFLAELNASLPVSRLAKWKTALQMMALSCLLFHPSTAPELYLHNLGLIGLWTAAAFTLITGYDYLKASAQYLE